MSDKVYSEEELKRLIPIGSYCYSSTAGDCPFWKHIGEDAAGCLHLNIQDSKAESCASPSTATLVWDKVKACGINPRVRPKKEE